MLVPSADMDTDTFVNPWAGMSPSQIKAQLDKNHAVLSQREMLWRDRQPLLQARGYMLRPRYHPGWVASWEADPGLDSDLCEDYIEPPVCRPLLPILRHRHL